MSTKGIIFYTDSVLDEKIAKPVREQLLKATDLPIISTSLKPLDLGTNFVIDAERGYLTMFQQILVALEESEADIIFHCEHDVLYPKEHFDFTPPDKDKFYYNLNWWKIRDDGLAVHWDAVQVSGLCAYRELLLEFYRERVASFDPDNFDRKFEPTVETLYETWRSKVPMIDIRHNQNLTYNKWKLEHFRKKETAVNFQQGRVEDILGWSDLSSII